MNWLIKFAQSSIGDHILTERIRKYCDTYKKVLMITSDEKQVPEYGMSESSSCIESNQLKYNHHFDFTKVSRNVSAQDILDILDKHPSHGVVVWNVDVAHWLEYTASKEEQGKCLNYFANSKKLNILTLTPNISGVTDFQTKWLGKLSIVRFEFEPNMFDDDYYKLYHSLPVLQSAHKHFLITKHRNKILLGANAPAPKDGFLAKYLRDNGVVMQHAEDLTGNNVEEELDESPIETLMPNFKDFMSFNTTWCIAKRNGIDLIPSSAFAISEPFDPAWQFENGSPTNYLDL